MSKWEEYGETFLELRARGMSYDKISKRISVSKQTLVLWGKTWASKIQDLKAQRMAKFVDSHLVALEHRLELRAEQIMRLRDELEGRDLGKLSEEQLLGIYLRYVNGVQKEVEPVKVEVTNPLATYKDILIQCLEIPKDTTIDDIPRLAAELAGETRKQLVDQEVADPQGGGEEVDQK